MNSFIPTLRIFLLTIAFLSFSVSARAAGAATFQNVMQNRLTQAVEAKKSIVIGGEKLLGLATIERMYHLNGYNSLWSDAAVAQLLGEINEAVEMDGLQQKDYFIPGLERMEQGEKLTDLDVNARVERELALTESFLRLAYHLRFGKVDPVSLDPDWNYNKRLDMDDPVPLLNQAIKDQKIKSLMNRERPDHEYYEKLRKVFAQYREIEARGGWEAIEAGNTIKPGDKDVRVLAIRKRLMATGDLAGQEGEVALSPVYDANLQKAVIGFQERQGLDADGKIGKNTVKALNISAHDKINQIRVNLERLRWIMHELGDDFLLVDIPGFKVFLIKDGKRVWEAKIVIGKAFTATPVFKDELEYLEFNPTWTIPPGIIKRTILPNLKKDPGYLDRKGYLLLDFNGKKINPRSIDWKKVKGFPYMVRQPAGKNNALGLVKFIFPNPHFVFLHDTNHRELFSRNTRTLSAGCIRVERPFELAELVLESRPEWSRGEIDQLVASGKTKRVHTNEQLPVLITYTTVGVSDEGRAIFKPDVYDRDPGVLKGLQGSIKVAADVKKVMKKFNSGSQEDVNYIVKPAF